VIFSGELTLVDWKTVSYASERRNNDTETSLSNLYNNPMQIAAYVAAVNSDPAYRLLPPITHAAIVLAYKDGRDVEVLRMSEQDIQGHFDQFCVRLNKFWWNIENTEESNGAIQFVYNPMSEADPIEQEPFAIA